MTNWHISVSATAPPGSVVPDLEEPLDDFGDFFSDYSGVCGIGVLGRISATFNLDDIEAVEDAAAVGVQVFRDAAMAVGYPDWPIGEVDVTEEVLFVSRESLPLILGVKDLAAACGVTASAVSNWIRRGKLPPSYRPDVPTWPREALEDYITSYLSRNIETADASQASAI